MLYNFSDLLGKGFKFEARGPDKYDCWGICMEVSKRTGKPLPSYQSYEDLGLRNLEIRSRGDSDFVKLQKPEPFCIIAFHSLSKYVTHMGIVLEDCKRFIHIREQTSVCIERINTQVWQRKLQGFYKYVGPTPDNQD